MSTLTAAPDRTRPDHAGAQDFDLHGLVGIRLLGATPRDVAVVRHQVGPIDATLSREPDIEIRFVDRLEIRGKVRLLGADECGYTDDAFLVLRAKQKAKTRVEIPFDRVGGRIRIVCERGLPAVPLLIPIVNLTALGKGALPMHASAFTYRDVGVMTTGWAKGGKTESLLAFVSRGARYVGDEWVYLHEDGQRMFGIPEPIRIWDWHLEEMPEFRRQVRFADRARLALLRNLVRGMEGIADRAPRSGLGRLLRRIVPLAKRQQWVQMPPGRLFGTATDGSARPEKVFLIASHESPEITVSPIEPEEVARRMVFSLLEERADFLSFYWTFRFAFPERRNELIESAEQIQRDALLRMLDGKETYLVEHPYPVSIPALYDVMAPYVAAGA